MNTKHPERRPIDQVEGVIRIEDLNGNRLVFSPRKPDNILPLVRVMVETADRTIRERNERLAEHKESA